MSDETKRDDELGALWVKEGQKGEFMTGSVICTQCKHKEDIILFKNQFRTKENHPAWRILKSRQQGERHTYAPSTRRDEQPRKTVFAAEEEFDSRTRPQQQYADRKPDYVKPARDWTADVPPIAVTDDDIPF